MAGKKGMKGGGGARPGAGRKKKESAPLSPPAGCHVASDAVKSGDPIAFLERVMADECADAKLRVDAAKAILPYKAKKIGEDGKKGERQGAAKKATQGRFAPAAPPKLVVSNK